MINKDDTKILKLFELNTLNSLTTEKNIAIREKAHLELMNYPLLNYCPNSMYNPSVVDSILSISYSTAITKEEMADKLGNLINQSLIIQDVLSIIAISTTIDASKPFSIALIGDNMSLYDPTNSNRGGYYNSKDNKLVVVNKNSELNLKVVTHELAHKTIDIIFNHKSKPYYSLIKAQFDSKIYTKDKYHTAIKNTLLNIQSFIKKSSGLDIIFEDQNDTWKMGKSLSGILFPQNIKEFISTLKQYNLNIDTKFSWLDGYSPLGYVLLSLDFELADTLVKAGASIHPTILHVSSIFSSMELLNWFLENKQEIDINHKNCEGMTALDYANDPQMIKNLISLGAITYSYNYQPICSTDSECKDNEDNTITIKELSALNALLCFYNLDSFYDKYNEDAEFIVRLPEIIAAELYQGKIIEILEPLVEYWQEVVSPAVTAYQDQYDISDVCLNPLGYDKFF